MKNILFFALVTVVASVSAAPVALPEEISIREPDAMHAETREITPTSDDEDDLPAFHGNYNGYMGYGIGDGGGDKPYKREDASSDDEDDLPAFHGNYNGYSGYGIGDGGGDKPYKREDASSDDEDDLPAFHGNYNGYSGYGIGDGGGDKPYKRHTTSVEDKNTV